MSETVDSESTVIPAGTEINITTNDEYVVIFCDDTKVSATAFKELKDYMTLQGFMFLPDCQKRMDKWYKQPKKYFAMIQTRLHSDPKVVTLASERENGSIWIHDILPLCPVMEQPFRSLMISWMENFAKVNNKTIIVPKWLRESAVLDEKDNITIDEASTLFDKGTAEMASTGSKSAVVTHKVI